MARFPDVEVERLKREVSIERLAVSAGVPLGGRGDDLVGGCPFCAATDGLVVSPAPNLWRCGGCGSGGSVIDWVMAAEGVSMRHALELLRDGFTPTRLNGKPPGRSTVHRLDGPFSADLADAELLDAVVGFYHQSLLESPEARGYLAERRIADGEAVDRFRLGYANRTLGYRLPAVNRAPGRALRGRLKDLGVLRADTGHEHFNGSLVIPVCDEHGRVTQVYGRKIGSGLRKGTALHLWLPGGPRGVWNLPALDSADEVVVCESLIDALSLWCVGFRNVTAAAGPDGFGEDLWRAFRERGVARVVFAFDADPEGDKAAQDLAREFLAEGVECYRLRPPKGRDINDVACGSKSAAAALGELVRRAEWMGSGRPAGSRRRPLAPTDDVPTDDLAPDNATDETVSAAVEVVEEVPARTVVPTGPGPDVEPHVEADELVVVLGDRRWRVRGLARNTSFDALRVNVLASVIGGEGFHVDTLDLYAARPRAAFIAATAAELGVADDVIKRDLGRVLFAVEADVERRIRDAQEPTVTTVELEPEERAAALELLQAPDLVDRLVTDFARAGVVGEATNCLVGYLAATSRLLERPLAVIVQSTSAAGKSQLMDAVLAFIPPEGVVSFSAMTGQSLYYLGDRDLAHRVLAIAEEEGAERAAYALKLLQSEGELSIASTGKDNNSGRLVTHEYRVAGPTSIFLTTTAIDVDEELLNRCLVLTVDEDRAQTRAIHDRQRRAHTLAGIVEHRRRDDVLGRWRNAQRLLEPVTVVNPYADRLGFCDGRTRTRRDHVKYLTLIQTIALLHQHQRPRRTATVDGETVTFIEATPVDIALANRLAHEVLGRSLDELAPQTRRLLAAVSELVEKEAAERDMAAGDVRFTRRAVREHAGWSDFQVRTHLARLVDLEYVLVHRGGRGQSFVYELLWTHPDTDSPVDGRVLPGLVDIGDEPVCGYDGNPELCGAHFEGGSSPQRGGFEEASSTPENNPPPGQEPAPGADRADSTAPGAEQDAVIDERAGDGDEIEGVG